MNGDLKISANLKNSNVNLKTQLTSKLKNGITLTGGTDLNLKNIKNSSLNVGIKIPLNGKG